MADTITSETARLNKKFHGLWHRACKLDNLGTLNAATVEEWARHAGLNIVEVKEEEVGIFQPTLAVVLIADGETAYFPKIPHTGDSRWQVNRTTRERIAKLWEKAEWFAPLWVAQGKYNRLLQDIEYSSKEDAIKHFDYHTSTIYTLAFQAVCIAQLIPRSRSLVDFSPIAREAYLAFYAGHKASSIAALIPVMEGALRRIWEDAGDNLPITDRIDRIIDRACSLASRLHFNGNWVPPQYRTSDYLYGQDERIFVFETFRSWLKGTFFRSTGEYDGFTWLNRHLFAHGTSTEWQNGGNFCRLIVALATLGVIESWHDESNAVPTLFPEMNDDSHLLWQQAILQGQSQMVLKLTEQRNYHKKGRLVPETPMDDGVILRKTLLTQECIRDLVRPLRDAGWNVEVKEPDAKALYMAVEARSGDSVLRVALLYSCATANELYRQLARTSDAILYVGAPYHQSQYAYGIAVHVGPVSAWQPPLASSDKKSLIAIWGNRLQLLLRRILPTRTQT